MDILGASDVVTNDDVINVKTKVDDVVDKVKKVVDKIGENLSKFGETSDAVISVRDYMPVLIIAVVIVGIIIMRK